MDRAALSLALEFDYSYLVPTIAATLNPKHELARNERKAFKYISALLAAGAKKGTSDYGIYATTLADDLLSKNLHRAALTPEIAAELMAQLTDQFDKLKQPVEVYELLNQ